MEKLKEARDKIFAEVVSDDQEVRAEYLSLFEKHIEYFSDLMAKAFIKWRVLDENVKGDDKIAYVSAFTHTAIRLHILSLKLLVSGHTVAAGNLMRQVLESIALALICAGKDIGILEKFIENRYRTNSAIRDVKRYASILGLNMEGLEALSDAQRFYHQYSHPTRLTLANGMSWSENGSYVGASFDEKKVEAYKKEVDSRIGLAEVFPNFIEAVIANVGKW
jgi:predicted lipoprotein